MRLRWVLFHILIGLTILGCNTPEAEANLSVEASLSHLSFAVDEGTVLSITVNGSGRISSIDLPEIDGISFSSRGQSSRINIINGSVSSSLTNNYLIQAEKPGIYTLPPIKVSAGGDSTTTKPMSFEVTAAAAAPGPTPGRSDRSAAPGDVAFIRVSEVSSHYPGEIVPVTIKAYFKQDFRTDINSLPVLQGDGVVMPQLREKPTQSQERVNGETYNVLTWDTTLSGIKEGSHHLSFTLDASLLIPQRRQGRSLFGGGGLFDDSMFNDPLFDSFFGGYQKKPISVKSPQIVFEVNPLPTKGRPANFTGAIGIFELKVTANHQELEVGEPLTLTMTISGRGNFDRVDAPIFPDSPDWKTYSPTSSTADQGISGAKTFEQAIVAKNSTVKEIPALSFSYFDPDQKSYVTRTSSPINITVKTSSAPPPAQTVPTVAAAQQPKAVADNVKKGMEGLAPIHLETGRFQQNIVPLFQKSWFLALCALFIVVLVALFLASIRQQRIEKNPERVRLRLKRDQLSEDLKKIEQAKATGDGVAFLALSRNAIQNQLGRLWNMEPNAISLADLRTRLQPASHLLEIFRAADEATYGGAPPSIDKMQDYLGKLRQELEDML